MNLYLIILLIILLAIFFITIMIIDNLRFVIRKYQYCSPAVKEKVTFAFVSDLHGKDYGNHNEKVLKAIRQIRPDAILCGGDMIISRPVSQGKMASLNTATRFLSDLAKEFPVYLAEGNHESRLHSIERYAAINEQYVRNLETCGVQYLHNTYTDFKGVRIYGLDLDQISYQKILPYHLSDNAVRDKLGEMPEDILTIVMAHNPKYFPNYAGWGADIILSGHVHGGLLRIGGIGLIAPDLHLFPKYSGGEYTLPKDESNKGAFNVSHMIVSCGIGAHTLPIRIFNPGEISIVEILPQSK